MTTRPTPFRTREPRAGFQWCVLDAAGQLVCECDGAEDGAEEAAGIVDALNRVHTPYVAPPPETREEKIQSLLEGGYGPIQPHVFCGALFIKRDEAIALMWELAAAGRVQVKKAVYHRACDDMPVAYIEATDEVDFEAECPECGECDPDPKRWYTELVSVPRARAL